MISMSELACVRGSVLRWRCCGMACTSGFVDDVMFSYNGPYGGVALTQQSRCPTTRILYGDHRLL